MQRLLLLPWLFAAAGCVTTQAHSHRDVPSDFTQAEQTLSEARSGAAGRALPRSLERARTALDQGYVLLDQAEAEPAEGLRTRYLQAALRKAAEAGQLAGDAKELGLKIASWDGRIEEYAEEKTSGQLLELMAAEVTAACGTGGGGEAPGLGSGGLDPESAGASGPRASSASLENTELTTPVAFFASGTDALREQDLPLIESLAELLLADPSLKVRLVGHADEKGPERTNAALSLRRAHTVASVLMEAGIRQSRIEVARPTPEEALDGGPTEGERQLVRRVEAHVRGGSSEDGEGFVP